MLDSSVHSWVDMPHFEHMANQVKGQLLPQSEKTDDYDHQARRLAHLRPDQTEEKQSPNHAVEAKFVTAHDPVVVTADNGRLPVIPIDEAVKLNRLKAESEGREPEGQPKSCIREGIDGTVHGIAPTTNGSVSQNDRISQNERTDAPLHEAVPSSRTNPLFPPLPMYGPPTWPRTLQCWFLRATSAVLSFCFLLAIMIGAAATAVPKITKRVRLLMTLQNPDSRRPFHNEEKKRRKARAAADKAWAQQKRSGGTQTPSGESAPHPDFVPTEGGPDPLICDAAYYARRVGLDMEVFNVETEDGFIIELWHVYNPREYKSPPAENRDIRGPDLFRTKSTDAVHGETQEKFADGQKKYPVLMIHGLLQSAGAYCCTGEDSFAFYLAKSGYDVWLGNNRCGFNPRHTVLKYEDPRMWAWNIRQMGVLDLPALISRVLAETGFPKLALIAHSQGTTQTLVALAKEQRPDIGEKISVFCALAPAAYAGPLIGQMYFKVMRAISPAVFRLVFGIHAFIPFMMDMHKILPGGFYAWMGYRVFSFLFDWTDLRWDRGLRGRMFQFAPVYVSAESMRWWLGRECFARQKCILATREEGRLEDKEDEEDDEVIRKYYVDREPHVTERRKLQRNLTSFHCQTPAHQHHDSTRGRHAWYDQQFPPLALWVGGADNLVDGRRLLRRFDRGREPHVRVVHKKIIEGYEHLDVIWAMDAVEKVGKEVREVIWRTADPDSQARCRVPVGCDQPLEHHAPDAPPSSGLGDPAAAMHSGGRLRMASISEAPPRAPHQDEPKSPTLIDASTGE